MGAVRVIIFHPRQPTPPGSSRPVGSLPLTRLLAQARDALIEHQAHLFRAAGATTVEVVRERAPSFGAALRRLAHPTRVGPPGVIILGAGAVPLLRAPDAARLVAVAASGTRNALTNNRYSSDVCAIGDATILAAVPDLPGDNALPRWLADRAAVFVADLPARERLAMDLDTPLDLGLLALAAGAPAPLRDLARTSGLAVPRLAEMRALLADPRRELLVFGRASSRSLARLERRAACRVRFLAEERGLRAATPLAQALPSGPRLRTGERPRPPRATLGRLLEARGGAAALARTVAELADGALIDSRVLLADRLGADEAAWPSAEDRYASDLLRPAAIVDPWLLELTRSAATAPLPILLGGHTLVGPGSGLLLLRRTAPPA